MRGGSGGGVGGLALIVRFRHRLIHAEKVQGTVNIPHLDIGYGPLISWPPTNQLTSQVKINLQQSAPSSHEHAELQALQLGNHKNVWS